MPSRTLLLSASRVKRIISRLAFEIVERNRGTETLELFGVEKRGVAVAEALAAEIRKIGDDQVGAHPLDVTPFRDDLDVSSERGQPGDAPNVRDRNVIVVDDVLFTGRTARAALEAILAYGRPASIQLVVLIDRGHREYPIQPDFVGQRIPTKHRERVIVETSPELQVYLDE